MFASPYPKNNVEIAQSFFEDAFDLADRFDITFERYHAIKTRRFKCFIDLRWAYECILKAIIAYSQPRDMERGALIKATEQAKHKISVLERTVMEGNNTFGVEPCGDQLDQLPIGLRYALDGYDFRDAKEELYYDTIGSDVWLENFRKYVGQLMSRVGDELSKHGGIINAADIPIEEIIGDKFNKFRG